MSAPRSKQASMIKRYGKMAEGYQARIEAQLESMNRMLSALAIAQDALYGIEHEAKDVRQARKWAKDAATNINQALQKEKSDVE